MLTLLFVVLMVYVYVKLIGLAVKMTWGIFKGAVTLVLLPLMLIGMVAVGLVYLALPILAVAGIVLFVVTR